MPENELKRYMRSMEHHIKRTEVLIAVNTVAFVFLTAIILVFTYFIARGRDADSALAASLPYSIGLTVIVVVLIAFAFWKTKPIAN